MRKLNNKKLSSKQLSLLLAGSIALTSLVGCAKANTSETTEVTTTTTVVETTATPTPTPVEVSKDVATVDYMNRAKAVATTMYEANKEYFMEKDYTVEDLENVYYVLNGKYYDNEKNIIMDITELERSYEIILELVEPQRIIELSQQMKDVDKGYRSYNEYMDEVNASKLYDYSKAPLTNFIDVNEDNTDIRNFVTAYSIEMVKVTENLKNCVSYEDHMIDFFAVIRSAQTGDITDYKNINNYLHETTTDYGYGYLVAGIYKSTADMLNTVIDGEFVTVPVIKNGEVERYEDVRVGFTYDEQLLVNAHFFGDLYETEDILKARELEAELFQTYPNDVMCIKQDKINENFNYQPVKGNSKKYTI